MTDQIQDQDVELDENEIEEAHDRKNAEAQSIASVKGAEGKGTTAKEPGGKGGAKDPMQKLPGTKAGMINAMYMKASKMKKEELAGMYTKLMGETVAEDVAEVEGTNLQFEADFSQDLDALIESEATLSEEFKAKTAVIFEAAIKSKLAEEIDRLETDVLSVLRTFVEHIAVQISQVIQKNNSVLITGGGVFNSFLIKRIEAISGTEILLPKKELIEYKEALIFALLGFLKLCDRINCLSSVTGAKKDHSSGVVFLPEKQLSNT